MGECDPLPFGEPAQLSVLFSLWDLGNQALRIIPGAHVPMDVTTLVAKAALWKHPIGAQA